MIKSDSDESSNTPHQLWWFPPQEWDLICLGETLIRFWSRTSLAVFIALRCQILHLLILWKTHAGEIIVQDPSQTQAIKLQRNALYMISFQNHKRSKTTKSGTLQQSSSYPWQFLWYWLVLLLWDERVFSLKKLQGKYKNTAKHRNQCLTKGLERANQLNVYCFRQYKSKWTGKCAQRTSSELSFLHNYSDGQ